MKKNGFAMLLMVVAAAGCAQQGADQSSEIAAVLDRWEEALNSEDLDGIVALYTEDCRILAPNTELGQGHGFVREVFGEMIAAGLKGELDTIEAVAAGDIGYRVGSYALLSGDGALVDRGKFIEVWRKSYEGWRIANDIWNSDMPATGSDTILAVTHEVEDSARWLAAWQGEDSRHEMFAEHGAPRVRALQSSDNPKLTGLVIEVADIEAFQAFMSSDAAAASKAEDGVKDAKMHVFTEVN
jgi:ketosteroid isomerase-like protein